MIHQLHASAMRLGAELQELQAANSNVMGGDSDGMPQLAQLFSIKGSGGGAPQISNRPMLRMFQITSMARVVAHKEDDE